MEKKPQGKAARAEGWRLLPGQNRKIILRQGFDEA